MAVEHREEGVQRLVERMAEPAGRGDPAAVARRIEALDEVEALLGMAHDGTDIDLGRGSGKPDAPETPAHAFEIARVHQIVDHLHQMVLRNAIGARDLGDRAQPRLILRPHIEEHAHRIIGVARQAHRNPSNRLRSHNMYFCCMFQMSGIHAHQIHDWSES